MTRVRRRPGPASGPQPVGRRSERAGGSTRKANHVRKNRKLWESTSDWYDRHFQTVLSGRFAMAWGLWRIPEARLHLLGTVRHRDILELGCGAARWSIALKKRGARTFGLDSSRSQLYKAVRLQRAAGARFPIVQASAEQVPFRDASFDVIFCDWGAMTFCDPYRTVPECARLLRTGGALVFAHGSPIRALATNRSSETISRRLVNPYFGLHREEFRREVNFQLTYGGWIDLFVKNRLQVVGLSETQPKERMASRYLRRGEERWARSWPMESIWKLRKESAP